MTFIKRFVRDEEGADATEYALMLGLVALAIIGAVAGLGTQLHNAFNRIGTTVGSNTVVNNAG